MERFLGRLPLVMNVVIMSPHGYFGQSNVLGLPDTGGQVRSRGVVLLWDTRGRNLVCPSYRSGRLSFCLPGRVIFMWRLHMLTPPAKVISAMHSRQSSEATLPRASTCVAATCGGSRPTSTEAFFTDAPVPNTGALLHNVCVFVKCRKARQDPSCTAFCY